MQVVLYNGHKMVVVLLGVVLSCLIKNDDVLICHRISYGIHWTTDDSGSSLNWHVCVCVCDRESWHCPCNNLDFVLCFSAVVFVFVEVADVVQMYHFHLHHKWLQVSVEFANLPQYTCPLTHLSFDSSVHWHTYPLTHLSIDTAVRWLTCLLTLLSIDSPVHWLTCPWTHLSIDTPLCWLTCPLTHLSVDTPVRWLTCLLTFLSIDSPVHRLTCPLTHLSVDLPVHWLTSPLTHLSVDLPVCWRWWNCCLLCASLFVYYVCSVSSAAVKSHADITSCQVSSDMCI